MRRIAVLLLILATVAVTAAQTPDSPIFLLRDDGVLYIDTGSTVGEADAYVQVAEPSEDPDVLQFAQVFAALNESVYPVSAPVSVIPGPGGQIDLPMLLAAYPEADPHVLHVRIRTTEGLILSFSGGVLTGFERADGEQPELAVVYPSDLGLDDTTGRYASIDGVLIRLPVEGWVYQIDYPLDDGRVAFTSVRFEEVDGIQTRIDRLYVLDTETFAVTRIVEDHIVLEGDMRLMPDGETLLYTAYSDETGAAVWKVGVDGQTPPDMIAGGLMFWADAGNFILPQIVDVTDDAFTISTFGLDYSEDDVQELGELLTYSLDGDLLGTAPKPTPER